MTIILSIGAVAAGVAVLSLMASWVLAHVNSCFDEWEQEQ